METKPIYLTKPKLKERGWTDGMIRKFLDEPDTTRPNPYYKCAAPMALYELKRVEKAERSAKFKAEIEKSAVRKQSAQKAVETKTEKAKKFARTVAVHVPTMDYDNLVKKACNSYNEFHEYLLMERGHEYITANPTHSDPDFLRRITINYLRHECTSYEDELYKLFGKTGVHEAHDILQRRINDEICKVYPQLTVK